MPAVMASWYRETSIPRTFCGEISDKYSGTTKFTIPIAKPRIIRPAISQPTEEAKPQRIEPRAKMTAVAIMTFLRPYMSASTPFAAAPITAPTKAELTTQPLTGERPGVVNEQQGAGNDSGVKTGKQSAERGDCGDDIKPEVAGLVGGKSGCGHGINLSAGLLILKYIAIIIAKLRGF